MAVELTYEMLNEIFKHGKLSEQNRAHLLRDLDQIEKGYEKKLRLPLASANFLAGERAPLPFQPPEPVPQK